MSILGKMVGYLPVHLIHALLWRELVDPGLVSARLLSCMYG